MPIGRRCRSSSAQGAVLVNADERRSPGPAGQRREIIEQIAPRPGDSAKGIVRTALCVEPRHGRLHIFMPPVNATEDYLDLIAAIEDTAATLGTPVDRRRHAAAARSPAEPLHGDARSGRHRGQPAPGAQTGRSWSITRPRCTKRRGCRGSAPRSSCSTAATPAPAAAITSSSAGPTPADSPFLRRPDLLRSLVGYWHNHPSLSYLFSGLFIGPTSQHPRVDEARNDSLHELEIANALDSRSRRRAVAGRSDLPEHPHRRHRQHASRRVLHRQAVRAGDEQPTGAGSWSCGRSRCRRTRA